MDDSIFNDAFEYRTSDSHLDLFISEISLSFVRLEVGTLTTIIKVYLGLLLKIVFSSMTR